MEPINRKEVFLNALCADKSCGLEPVSREEILLKKLVDAEAAEGGGSGLPAGSKPNQYVVTDGEGNAKWEDKLCWSEEGKVALVEPFTEEYGTETPNRNRFPLTLEEGKNYTVKWDSVEYDCTCFVDEFDRLVVGNASLMEAGANTNEPFLVGVQDGDSFVKAQTGGDHELSIFGIGETIHKLSGKYVEGMGWSEVTKSYSDTLTWDGVLSDDDPSTKMGGNTMTYHRVSDEVPSVEQLSAGGTYTLCQNSEFMDMEFTSGDVEDKTSEGIIGVGPVIVACIDNVTFQGLTFPKSGIYFMSMTGGYVSGFKVNGCQLATVTETIHIIDKKYLPKPLVINATTLPTNTKGWGELNKMLCDAVSNGTEIKLDVYGTGELVLPCVTSDGTFSLFIMPPSMKTSLEVYRLEAYIADGGSLTKCLISMEAENS